MAIALVATGEGDKASRWMLEAAEGIAKEDLLHSIVVSRDGGQNQEADLAMRFHLICVQLLEQAALPSAALRVALAALNSSRSDDPLLPTMWSIVAKLHLHLGHYQVLLFYFFRLDFHLFLLNVNLKKLYRHLTRPSSAIPTVANDPRSLAAWSTFCWSGSTWTFYSSSPTPDWKTSWRRLSSGGPGRRIFCR